MSRNGQAATLTMPSDREIVITRVFNAPRSLVFEAWTTPKYVSRWYGAELLVVCEIDLRVGGRWRYVMRTPDGGEHGFSGEYREITPPERLVYTKGTKACRRTTTTWSPPPSPSTPDGRR